jgi:hypothetical protein
MRTVTWLHSDQFKDITRHTCVDTISRALNILGMWNSLNELTKAAAQVQAAAAKAVKDTGIGSTLVRQTIL